MRGTDEPNVHRLFDRRADLAHSALLDRAQQLDLHRQRQFGHFVEEKRSACGCLKESFSIALGAGERALAVTEELGLHQRLGNCTAIDRDKWLLASAG